MIGMGFFTKKAVASAIKRVVLGIVKETPIIGQIHDNIQSQDGGEGSFDWWKLIGSLLPLALLAYFVAGKISMEQLERLVKIFL